MKNVSKIAKEILAGAWVPDIESHKTTTVILRRDDFRNNSLFDSILEETGLNDAFHKKMQTKEPDAERDADTDDYDQITLHINKIVMEPR